MTTYTTKTQVRLAFWDMHPQADKQKIKNYAGDGVMYCTDTRCLFVDFVDQLHRDGMITDELANTATL